MKRFKAFFLATVLTATFAGNIFATGGVATTLPSSLVTFAVSAFLSLTGGTDQCPLRQCTNCRPNNENGGDGNGDCRPTPE